MVAASLIATVASRDVTQDPVEADENVGPTYDRYDGYEDAAYLNGMARPVHYSFLRY